MLKRLEQHAVRADWAAVDSLLAARSEEEDPGKLMITEVARGSFGFILEEAEGPQLVESSLRRTVDEVVDLIYRTAAPDEEAFEAFTEAVDNRVLGSLRSFFRLLDDSGATIRIVDEQREFNLARDSVERARERTESLTVEDQQRAMAGILYILPEGRKFELHPVGGGQTIRGNVTPDCLQSITRRAGEVTPGIIGSVRRVTLWVREVRGPSHPPRHSYTLAVVADADG